MIVEQSVNVALLLAERAIFLEKGQVRFTGPAGELLERPDLLRAVFIGGDVAKPGGVANGIQNGRRPAIAASEPSAPADPVLECRGLVKRFGGITAVDHVDLAVRPGELLGLIGHNGAGKTTLFDLLCGFLTPDDGRILLAGEDATAVPPHERARAGLGRSFQEARLFPRPHGQETISVALDRRLASHEPCRGRLPHASLHRLRGRRRRPRRRDHRAARIGRVPAPPHAASCPPAPGGSSSSPASWPNSRSVVLLDEPSGGVAQAETEALGRCCSTGRATDTGCAMVVIEHDMALLSSLCDRLVAFELGRVIAEGDPADVLAHPEVVASYLGTDKATIERSGRRRGRLVASSRK